MHPHQKETSVPRIAAVGLALTLALTLTSVFPSPASGEAAIQIRLPRAEATQAFVVPADPASPKSGGKALLMAMRSLRLADRRAKDRPMTIRLEPGVYDLGTASLRMIPGVDIEGSGIDETEIVGLGQSFGSADFSFDVGVVVGADDAELRDLTVRCVNDAERDTCVTMANREASPSLDNVRLMAVHPEGGHWGLRNNESSPSLTDVDIVVANGANNYGMVNEGEGSRPELRRSTVTAVSGDGENIGILNKLEGLPERLTSVEIVAANGFRAAGIRTLPPGIFSGGQRESDRQDLKTMKLVNVQISAFDAGHTYGLFQGLYSLEMRDCRVISDDSAIDLAPHGDADVQASELHADEFFVAAANVRIVGSTLLGAGEVVALHAECSGITTETGTQDSCP